MNDMKVISCTKEIAGRNVTLETGKIARQATGSVVAHQVIPKSWSL